MIVSSGAAFQMRRLMDDTDRLFVKVKDPAPDVWERVARRANAEPDGLELLQMLGLVPYRSARRPRDYRAEYLARNRRQPQTHNANGYKSGCRCAVCREAMSEHRRVYRPPIREHGTETAYKNSGCRCDLCRRAAGEANRRRRDAITMERRAA